MPQPRPLAHLISALIQLRRRSGGITLSSDGLELNRLSYCGLLIEHMNVSSTAAINHRWFSRCFIGIFLFAYFLCASAAVTCAQQASSTAVSAVPENASTVQFRVQQGLAGSWKVGYETMLTVSTTVKAENWTAEIVTADGDGVPVSYSSEFVLLSTNSSQANIVVRHGRANRAMRLIVRDEDELILDRELTNEERGSVLPLHQPWIVGLGPELQLDDISVAPMRGGMPSISLTNLATAADLPTDRFVYSAATTMVISTKDLEFVQAITDEQGKAIVDWVIAGGRIQIWVGENADSLKNIAWLTRLLPGQLVGTVRRVDPAVLESYVSASQTARLEPLTCAELAVKDARVGLSIVSPDRRPLPFIVQCALGAGTIDFVATDVNSREMIAWKDRVHLLERLFDVQSLQRMKDAGKENSAQFIGYNDLAGQIRSTLDLFNSVRSVRLRCYLSW